MGGSILKRRRAGAWWALPVQRVLSVAAALWTHSLGVIPVMAARARSSHDRLASDGPLTFSDTGAPPGAGRHVKGCSRGRRTGPCDPLWAVGPVNASVGKVPNSGSWRRGKPSAAP